MTNNNSRGGASGGGGRRGRGGGGDGARAPIICNFCGKPGHKMAKCPDIDNVRGVRFPGAEKPSAPPAKPPPAAKKRKREGEEDEEKEKALGAKMLSAVRDLPAEVMKKFEDAGWAIPVKKESVPLTDAAKNYCAELDQKLQSAKSGLKEAKAASKTRKEELAVAQKALDKANEEENEALKLVQELSRKLKELNPDKLSIEIEAMEQ